MGWSVLPLFLAAVGSPTGVSVHLPPADGKTWENALVDLVSIKSTFGAPAWATERTASDSSGRILFDPVPPGTYTLIARWAPGRTKQKRVSDQANSKEDSLAAPTVWWGFREGVAPGEDVLELPMLPAVQQAITVRTGTGEPAGDIRARLALKSTRTWKAPDGAPALPIVTLERRARSAAGRIVIDGVAPGKWVCVLSVPDYGRTAEFELEVPAEKEPEIVVPEFISVSGEVHAPDGISIERVWVGLEYERTYVPDDVPPVAYTDSSGKFVLQNVRPGQAELTARTDPPRYRFSSKLTLEPGKPLTNVRAELVEAK